MGETLISYQKNLVISPKSTYTQTIKFTQLHTYLHIYIHMHKQVHTNIYLYVISRNIKEKILSIWSVGYNGQAAGKITCGGLNG